MRYLNLIITVVVALTFSTQTFANSPEDESYQSYNDIVSDLHGQLKTKASTTTDKLLNSSYSLAAGISSQMQKINNTSKNQIGIGVEIGAYNFLIVPLKVKLDYATAKDIKSILLKVKTDHSIYRYNLIDLKIGIAAGLGGYTVNKSNFTSIFLTPSVASFYQLNKNFDVSLNLDYSFHSSSEVSDHISPSVNLVTYF